MTSATVSPANSAMPGPNIPFENVALVQYHEPTGAVLRTLSLPRHSASGYLGVVGYLVGNGDEKWETHYVDLATKEIRLKTEAKPVVKGHTISGLPVPTMATLILKTDEMGGTFQGRYEVEDGELELTFGQPGTYRVLLSTASWNDTTIEFVVD
jgi:hypothetical protein